MSKRVIEYYRGYAINNNSLNQLWWISKGGYGVRYADDLADAKKIIDILLDGRME